KAPKAPECKESDTGTEETGASVVINNELLDAFAPVKLQLSLFGLPKVTECRAWQEMRIVHVIAEEDLRAITSELQHSDERIEALVSDIRGFTTEVFCRISNSSVGKAAQDCVGPSSCLSLVFALSDLMNHQDLQLPAAAHNMRLRLRKVSAPFAGFASRMNKRPAFVAAVVFHFRIQLSSADCQDLQPDKMHKCLVLILLSMLHTIHVVYGTVSCVTLTVAVFARMLQNHVNATLARVSTHAVAVNLADTAILATLFDYNRANFQNDVPQRFARFLSSRNMLNAQVGQYRQDVAGIATLTSSKMDASCMMITLILAVCAALSDAGRIGMHGAAPPEWLCGHIASAVLYMGAALWLAMHASLRAQCAMVSLPIPSMAQLDNARGSGSAFEQQQFGDIFRVPFMRHPEAAPELLEQSSDDDSKG
ncbi:unnamed protein product, partial [Polarella glacialis]